MKKLTALILVLMLALSFSTTAFAAAGVGADGSTGATEVTVEIDSSNISVTVPLSFTIVAKVDGGDATSPGTDAYQIKNNSTIPVRVEKIAIALNDATNWAFKDTAITAGAAPTTAGVNDIYMTVNGQVLAVQGATTPGTAASWNIPAHDGTDPGTLSLPIVASTSKLDQTTTATNLITITYTISAGTNS